MKYFNCICKDLMNNNRILMSCSLISKILCLCNQFLTQVHPFMSFLQIIVIRMWPRTIIIIMIIIIVTTINTLILLKWQISCLNSFIHSLIHYEEVNVFACNFRLNLNKLRKFARKFLTLQDEGGISLIFVGPLKNLNQVYRFCLIRNSVHNNLTLILSCHLTSPS